MNDHSTAYAAEPAGLRGRSGTHSPRRILVVEDDNCIRELNAHVLAGSGYHVDAVEDGAAAWQALLDAGHYDLIVTDNHMPKVTGIELLGRLRFARPELPVIMCSGALPTDVFARSPWLKPEATLLKPYTVNELLATVQTVLGASGCLREPVAAP
jgi:CheY-like chemotaxis protein